VTEIPTGSVIVYNGDGTKQMTFGGAGEGPGQFGPESIADGFAVDSKGRIYVSDSSEEVQVFNSDGNYLASITSAGDAELGRTQGPLRIVDDMLYVHDGAGRFTIYSIG
jgi:outer membrane protein assembly factor BamB